MVRDGGSIEIRMWLRGKVVVDRASSSKGMACLGGSIRPAVTNLTKK